MSADLILVLAPAFCAGFCLVILILVVVLYRKDPFCCAFTPDMTQYDTDNLSHYHAQHSLISIAPHGHNPTFNPSPSGPQLPGGLFIIGKPSDYHMDDRLPRLPSYESVRKNDRQIQIHRMISKRFGLSRDEPPTYEETFHLEIPPADILDIQQSVNRGRRNPDEGSPASLPRHPGSRSF